MRRTVVTICALLTLAACRGPEPIEPTPSPEPTGTTTAAPDPTVTEPTLPDQARRNTPEGAAAFVGYWVKTFNYAARTGDIRPIERVSEDCNACRPYLESLEEVASQGDLATRDLWDLRRTLVTRNGAVFEASATIRTRSSTGAKVERIGFRLRPGDSPRVIDLYRIES